MNATIRSGLSSAACRLTRPVALLLISSAIQGCSSQQLYGVGQGWQRQECNKINDTQQRDRCMAGANTSYDDYARQADDAKNGR
ncbi:MAG: hypothetical protein ACKVOX_12610 [Rhizobacter sp.]|jgi:hypothetical protein